MTYRAPSAAGFPPAVPQVSRAAGILRGPSLFQRVRGIIRSVMRRREIMQLASLDDRMLRDIGISRADVHAALVRPWLGDPTDILARRSAERWRRAHASAQRESLDRAIETHLQRCA